MSYRITRIAWAALIAATVIAFGPSASAQVFTGRIDVTVQDATGAVLPGVTVEVTGPQNATLATDEQGEAHFLNLAPGTYQVKATMQGFGDYMNESVPVGAGAGVPLRVSLRVGGVAEQVEVTAESPVIDPKRQSSATNVSLEELQNIPSSRDPWVVMQTVPGIVMDRVNVGGAESGQQSNYQAKGAPGTDNTWNMDGIPITDMSALGSTPTYYDFDMFQEMQVSTGGADVQSATPGVQLNFVLKAGGNTPHGSTRIYFENESMQSTNVPEDLFSLLGTTGKGNRIEQYADYGFEIGGPVLKDRIWAWGWYGKTDVRLRTLNNALDRTILDDRAFKATSQVTDWMRANYTYFRGDKLKYGRSAGPTRSIEASFDQSGPTAMHKGEASFVIGNNLFITGRGAKISGGFGLISRSGNSGQSYVDDDAVTRGGSGNYLSDRPQKTVLADGNYFRGNHELKFGFGWRKTPVESSYAYVGNQIVSIHNGYPNILAKITRPNGSGTEGKYLNAFIGDTISLDRLTINAGLRWDRATSSVLPVTVGASPAFPTILPSITGVGAKDAIKISSVSPRFGVTYALDEARKTLLRGSYAMFSSQLNAGQAGGLSVVQYSAIYYYAVDTNRNQVADPSEILFNLGNQGYYGFDPANPTDVGEPLNRIGDYDTPRTHEVLFGMDHELMPNFGISGTLIYRKFTHFNTPEEGRLIGVDGSDYRQVGVLSGNTPQTGPFSQPYYAIDPAAAAASGGGREFEAREGYHQRFWGFEFSATKRMSNRWMARLGFSTNDHREYFDDPLTSIEDPTPRQGYVTTAAAQWGPLKDGGLVSTQTTGSGKSGIYVVLPKYQFIANGAYQGPWGLNFGANLVNRQGYAQNFFRSNVATGDVRVNLKNVLVVDSVDDFRLPSVTSLDIRLEKAFALRRVNAIVDLDVFNIFNASTVLGRQYDLRSTAFNNVLEIMNPRIARIGVRFNF